MTIAEIFQTMRDRLAANPARVADLKASYQFEVTGEDSGVYHAAFDNGAVDIGEGGIENPGCTVVIASSDFQGLVAGTANPTALFMSGKLKLKGDMGLAMKLQSLLSR